MCNQSSQHYSSVLSWLLTHLNSLCKIHPFLAIPTAKAFAQTLIVWYFNHCHIIFLGLDLCILSMTTYIKHTIAQIIFPVPHFDKVPRRMCAVFVSAPVLHDGIHTVPCLQRIPLCWFRWDYRHEGLPPPTEPIPVLFLPLLFNLSSPLALFPLIVNTFWALQTVIWLLSHWHHSSPNRQWLFLNHISKLPSFFLIYWSS